MLEDFENSEKFLGNFEKFHENSRKIFPENKCFFSFPNVSVIFQMKPQKNRKIWIKNIGRFERNEWKEYASFQRIRIKLKIFVSSWKMNENEMKKMKMICKLSENSHKVKNIRQFVKNERKWYASFQRIRIKLKILVGLWKMNEKNMQAFREFA